MTFRGPNKMVYMFELNSKRIWDMLENQRNCWERERQRTEIPPEGP